MTNEAAERLRHGVRSYLPEFAAFPVDLDEALAAAKAEGAREAVERIRHELFEAFGLDLITLPVQEPADADVILQILDEEAAR